MFERLEKLGWCEAVGQRFYNLDDREIVYYFYKRAWCCEVRGGEVSFYRV